MSEYVRNIALASFTALGFALCLLGCGRDSAPETSAGTTGEIAKADTYQAGKVHSNDAGSGDWPSHGLTTDEQRFSSLSQINRDTVKELGLAWFRDMETNRAQEATPIVVHGVMYLTSSWSRVYAINALTGELIWRFDPKVPGAWARRLCCDVVNRGVAVDDERVYVGTLDGRLIALDAASGSVVWEQDTLVDRDRFYSITGAPRVANGKVFIGNGGAEFGVRGYVTAYEAETGAQSWRFFTVPGDPSLPFENPELKMAVETWKGGEWWKIGGGGTVWNSIVYDQELNQLYIGVGNGSPWSREIRSPGGGDNLFLSSIVALDPDTGVMKWYYQTTPGDNWDYTAVQDIALADLVVDGVLRKVLLQAPKNGFFYVLDRTDGKLLRAHPYTAVNWASHVDMETGRPVENPGSDYREKPTWVLPGSTGGHNWQAMSTDVAAGLVYLPTMENSLIFALPDEWIQTGSIDSRVARWKPGVELGRLAQLFLESPDAPESVGVLKAFDPLTGETKWSVKQDYYWNGGVLATAGGLVFQGDAQGMLSAYDKENGEVLWQFNTYTSILAPPITFMVDDIQYVSILTGGGGADLWGSGSPTASYKYGNHGFLLTFQLGGSEQLPAPTLVDRTIPEQIDVAGPMEHIAEGEKLYNNFCAACHGLFVQASSGIRDLRLTPPERQLIFKNIVLEGLFASAGMAAFNDVLSAEEVRKIHQFVRARATEDRNVAQGRKKEAQMTWITTP